MAQLMSLTIRQFLIEEGLEEAGLIFCNHRKTSDGISVNDTGGYAPSTDGLIRIHTVQILAKYYNARARNESRNAYEVIENIYQAMLTLRHRQIDDAYIYFCRPLQEPSFFAQEDTNQVYVCNFEIHARATR